MAILEIQNLSTHYESSQGFFAAKKRVPILSNVSLEVQPGEILGIAGESGCGKSTLLKAILGIAPLGGGTVRFRGKSLSNLSRMELRTLRHDIQMVFQNPYSSLNPRMTVFQTLAEAICTRNYLMGNELKSKVAELLESVGLSASMVNRYPHAFSGGQRQRIAIARALATEPKLLLADEPTAALDVSSQAQILKLLKNLSEEKNLSIVFVSHNLGALAELTDRVGILYLGRLVELGPTREVLHTPSHPYTQMLCESVLTLEHIGKDFKTASHLAVNFDQKPKGCSFAPRCSKAEHGCRIEVPPLIPVGENRWAACPVVARDQNQ